MTAHPGHPVISTGDALSVSRDDINNALYTVKTTTQATVTVNYDPTVHGTHVLLDASGGVITVNLPDPTAVPAVVDIRAVFKKIDVSGNAITIATDGTPTIDGAASISLAAQWDTTTLWNDGLQWYIEQ